MAAARKPPIKAKGVRPATWRTSDLPLKARRLLGFAFASADLLIEIGPAGEIAFALGASEALAGSAETEISGRPWRDFIDASDQRMLAMLFYALPPGRGSSRGIVRLPTPERPARLPALRLPQNGGAISCA